LSTPDPDGKGKPFWREMTVAQIREPDGAQYVEAAFLESARFYELPRTHPGFARILAQLHDAMAKRRVVKVRLASLDSGIIQDVSGP
jgi:hypothetical protein